MRGFMVSRFTRYGLIMANLYYVMGASGVGKDSLLRYARSHLPADSGVVFAHRYITRAASAGGENHIELSDSEFNQRLDSGCFALHWRSHGACYGIGQEINHWLDIGLSVVVNGSRAYLGQASQKYPDLVPILITASDEQLRSRLESRGREQGHALEQRLQRANLLDAQVEHPRLICIDNDGELEQAGSQLLRILTGEPVPVCV